MISWLFLGDKDYTNGTTQTWQANGKVLTVYKEFLTYAKSYKDELAATREQEKLILRGAEGQVYSSKAYFERLVVVYVYDYSGTYSNYRNTVTLDRGTGGRALLYGVL